MVGSRARYHRVQTATMAGRGAKAGTARRARGGGRAHPAIRHRVCIRTRSGVRRLTILVPIGAAFGHGTRTHTLSRTLTGREASKCAVRPQSAARAEHLSRAPGEQSTTTGAPPRCRFSFRRLGPPQNRALGPSGRSPRQRGLFSPAANVGTARTRTCGSRSDLQTRPRSQVVLCPQNRSASAGGG